jgi:subtilisin
VAGILGAKDDAEGAVGVAPGVRLWSVRTLNSAGGGYASTQLCGIDWVTANAPALGIKVVNSSQALIGPADAGNCGQNNGDPLHQAICASTAAGTLWVFAGGNSQASLGLGAGSSFDEVLAVTAVADNNGQPNIGSTTSFTCPVLNGTRKYPNSAPETDDRYAGFSNWAVNGDIAHTIAAPGTCIWSTWKGGTYGKLSGTSMAAPHAAGVAHLCIAAGQCPGTPAETIQKLRADAEAHTQANPDRGFTGDPLRPVPDRFYGYLLRGDAY